MYAAAGDGARHRGHAVLALIINSACHYKPNVTEIFYVNIINELIVII